MDKIISKILVFVIIPDEPPPKYLADWVKSIQESIPEMAKALAEAIPDFKAYLEKIVQPGTEAIKGWLKPGYRTKRGRTYQDVINTAEANFRNGYKKFKVKIKRMFETVDGEEAKRLRETIEYRAYHACLRMARLNLPFTGYEDEIRGLAPFAARWLSGDETVKALLIDPDKVFVGGPVLITEPDRAGKFRNELIQRIKQAGAQIVKSGNYDPEVIRVENDRTNQLVNQFIRGNIVPFAQGGDSHIDFVVLNDKLYLKIQVALR